MRALVIENDLLSTTVLLDQGADLNSLVYKPRGINVLWTPPRPPRESGVGPAPAGDSQALWLAYYRGGWQVIFPNFGPPVEYKGAPLDMHGEAARTVWQLEEIESDGERVQVTLSVVLLKSPFHIKRVMSLQAGQPVLVIEETITNDGPEAMDCMWGHHPAFGPPLLSHECVLDTGARAVESDDSYDVPANDLPLGTSWSWPIARNSQGQEIDLSRVPPAGAGFSRLMFLKEFEEPWYALTNPQLELGIGLVWNKELFPYVCLYQETGGVTDYPWYGEAYAVMIEPNSSYPGQGLIAAMEKTGTELTFAPGESRTLELCAVFYEGSRRVARIAPDGTVQRS
jgi:galactose mutarotase-like enzyme